MKRLLLGLLIGLGLTAGVAKAVSTFNSTQLGPAPCSGCVLSTDGGNPGINSWIVNTGGGGGGGGGFSTSTPNILFSSFPNTTGAIVGINSSTPTANLVVRGISGSSTPILIIATSTNVALLTVASNGSTTLSSLGTGFVKSSSGSLYTDTNTYLTGNQTITLSGDVSGSGATAITTAIGAGKVLNSMIANSTIDLTAKVTGILPVANGGTATNTLADLKVSSSNLSITGGQQVLIGTSTTITLAASPTFTNGTFTGTLSVSATSTLATATVTNLLDSALVSGNCVQAAAGGQLTTTGSACGAGGGSGNSAWTIGNGFIYNATTTDLVGIGTTTPAAKLDITNVGRATNSPAIILRDPSGADSLEIYAPTSTDLNLFIGYQAGQLNNSGQANTALGYQALQANTNGADNTAIGTQTLFVSATGTDNTAIGAGALASVNGQNDNTAVGSLAMNSLLTGSGNTAIGEGSMQNAKSGANNVAIGLFSLLNNNGGILNIALGESSMQHNTVGSANVAIGNNALNLNATDSNITAIGNGALQNENGGLDNTAIGNLALNTLTFGAQNTAIGDSALKLLTSATSSTAVGYQALKNTTSASTTAIGTNAGLTNTSGSANTFLGAYTDAKTNNLTNSTAIGANALFSASNSLILGNAVSVGIGTSSPLATLDVYGLPGSNPAFRVSSSTNLSLFQVAANGSTTLSSLTTGLVISTSGGSLYNYGGASNCGNATAVIGLSVSGATTCSLNGLQAALTNPDTGTGTNGQVAYFTGVTSLTSASKFLYNGTVAGWNATSSAFDFNIQATANITPFNIASSSGTSIFVVASSTNIGMGSTTPTADLTVQATSGGTNPVLTVATSTGATYLTILAGGNVGIGSSSPSSLFTVDAGTTVGTASTTVIIPQKFQIDTYNSAGTRVCMTIVGTTPTVTTGACP